MHVMHAIMHNISNNSDDIITNIHQGLEEIEKNNMRQDNKIVVSLIADENNSYKDKDCNNVIDLMYKIKSNCPEVDGFDLPQVYPKFIIDNKKETKIQKRLNLKNYNDTDQLAALRNNIRCGQPQF